MIFLEDLPYDFAQLDVAERQAQLAPSQDPIVTRVEQAGGALISRFWLDNSLFVQLPAGRLAEAYCWPQVTGVEVSTPFWHAVARPWDESALGTSECPIENGACPRHCVAIEGQRFNAAAECLESSARLLTCSTATDAAFPANEKCRGSAALGELYLLGGAAPLEPEYRNFRDCSEAESTRVLGAASCD
jgi:hypothetical protein